MFDYEAYLRFDKKDVGKVAQFIADHGFLGEFRSQDESTNIQFASFNNEIQQRQRRIRSDNTPTRELGEMLYLLEEIFKKYDDLCEESDIQQDELLDLKAEIAAAVNFYVQLFRQPRHRVLYLAANPVDLNELRLGEEAQEIRNILQSSTQRDSFDIEVVWCTRYRELLRAMMKQRPDVLHFSGHGSKDAALYLEGSDGTSRRIETETLHRLLKAMKYQVKCVILNACHSSEQAKVISQYVPWIIGMSEDISDRAAIAFSSGFYIALGEGRGFDEAFDVGCTAISFECPAEPHIPILIKSGDESKLVKL